MTKKEIFTIPNLLGYLRLILIPVFAVLYLNDYYAGAIIALAISILSDFFDGILARKLHQVTELGKLIDPVADKFTQATVVICCAFHFPLLWPLFGIEFVKEMFMIIAGAVTIKRLDRKLNGAKWYGKITTAIMDFILLSLVIFPHMSTGLSTGLIIFCGICMIITLILYIAEYRRMWHE